MNTSKTTKVELVKESNTTLEIVRATKFLMGQIKKGWNVSEAFIQLEQSYGFHIKECVIFHLSHSLNK